MCPCGSSMGICLEQSMALLRGTSALSVSRSNEAPITLSCSSPLCHLFPSKLAVSSLPLLVYDWLSTYQSFPQLVTPAPPVGSI